jgi:UDP-N-acetylglucosamine 2-epimerase (non-hydrolysing)
MKSAARQQPSRIRSTEVKPRIAGAVSSTGSVPTVSILVPACSQGRSVERTTPLNHGASAVPAEDDEAPMPARQNIWCILGTRPEVIKLAPVIQELRRHPEHCQLTVCLTGQHREMVAPLVTLFDLRPDFDLEVMRPGQMPADVFASIIGKLGTLWQKRAPDWVVVQGDTTTTAAAALAGFYAKARVAHVEAGLRTDDRHQPFPEEINRRLVTQVADVHFAPTALARQNLLSEGIAEDAVELTGNTVVDALRWAGQQAAPGGPLSGLLARLNPARKLILLTCHRRENHGEPLSQLLSAVACLAKHHEERIEFVFPVHPNPAVQHLANAHLQNLPNVHLIAPLPYLGMVHLLKQCWLVMTDSGGLQEEAPAFGVPVLILREKTERPEAIEAGVARLVGTNSATITSAVESLLINDDLYAAMSKVVSPFGDGRAAQRIARRLLLGTAVSQTLSHSQLEPSLP